MKTGIQKKGTGFRIPRLRTSRAGKCGMTIEDIFMQGSIISLLIAEFALSKKRRLLHFVRNDKSEGLAMTGDFKTDYLAERNNQIFIERGENVT